MSLTTIEERTKLRFPDELRTGDTYSAPEDISDYEPLASLGDIAW